MKKLLMITTLIFIFILNINAPYAKEKKYNYEVEFGKSKEEKILQFNGNGNVNITGYNGNKILLSSDENIFKDDETNEKAKGLKKIGGGGFNIINNKEKNVIIVSRPALKKINLDVKVPNNITLKFGTGAAKPSNGFHLSKVLQMIGPDYEKKAKEIKKLSKELEIHTKELEIHTKELEKKAEILVKNAKKLEKESAKLIELEQIGAPIKWIMGGASNGIIEGDITINEFTGIVEASTIQGGITVKNMDGMVLANTVEGDINVTFKKLNSEKELYFSTVNGDIDITFPKKTNANVMAKAIEGDVYSGFDSDVSYGKEVSEITHDKYSRYSFQSDYITTKINKGGQDVYLNTVKGSIYIRKGK